MKIKSLQFGKAMSAALFVLLLSVVGMKNALAQTQVATLQHGEDISVFYGQNAFVLAHTAAETGDIITLSSGTFTPCDITKAITLRGAGCAIDTITGTYPTIIPNTLQIDITNDTAFITIEGIFFSGTANFVNLNHPKFIKCNIKSLQYKYSSTSSMQNAQFVNCKVENYNFSYAANTTLINCVVWSASGLDNVERTVTAYNCFLRLYGSAYALNAYNCIIGQTDGYHVLERNSIAYNSIGLRNSGYGHPIFYGIPTYNCVAYTDSYTIVFETFHPGQYPIFSFDESFILTEEISTGFLGTDGTEVGIHGGIMPYSIRPSYMVIDHCNVANRSTIDGKLSVEIEVSTQGE